MITVYIGTNKPGKSFLFGEYSEQDLAEEFRSEHKIRGYFSTFPGPKSSSYWEKFSHDIHFMFTAPSPKTHWLVAYNEKGKLLTPELLIGILSPFWEIQRQKAREAQERYWSNLHSRVWGRFRKPRTTQEIRFAQETVHVDIDDETGEEIRIPVKFRARKHLPNSWDDIYAHAQKSWKRQTRRSHQYKETENEV